MPGDCVLGIDCDKNTSASGGQRPPDPLDPMHSYFSGNYNLPSSGAVSMSAYAVVLLKVRGRGGGRKVQ